MALDHCPRPPGHWNSSGNGTQKPRTYRRILTLQPFRTCAATVRNFLHLLFFEKPLLYHGQYDPISKSVRAEIMRLLKPYFSAVLLSLHYHHTNDWMSAWTSHGVACRFAIALGLHRQSVSRSFDALQQYLRQRVWWTLYSYEQFLCCSLGLTKIVRRNSYPSPS